MFPLLGLCCPGAGPFFFFYRNVNHHGDVWRHLVVGTELRQ